MAIWQFHVYLIPRQSLIVRYQKIPKQLEMNKEGWNDYIESGNFENEPDFEDALSISWWSDLNVNFNVLLPTFQQFGELQEWTAETTGLRNFGDTESHDIHTSFNPVTNNIENISCRLDLRQPDKGFIQKMLSLAKQFDCLFMDSLGRLYEPTIEDLIIKTEISNAYRFVKDPEQFFKDFSEGIISPE